MNMKSKLYEHYGLPLDALPEDLQAVLEANPTLKKEFEAQARVADLMQLKNYEQPDDAMFGRVHHRATIRLKQGSGLGVEPLMGPLPAWARMVTVVVVMLGLSILTHREMLRTSTEEDMQMAEGIESGVPWLNAETYDMPSDPFAPYVFSPASGWDQENSSFVGLSRELEEDFQFLGLDQTNRLESSGLVPVLLKPGQQP